MAGPNSWFAWCYVLYKNSYFPWSNDDHELLNEVGKLKSNENLLQISLSYYIMREKCRIRRFSGAGMMEKYFPNAEKYGPEKLRIRTFFTQWSWIIYWYCW